jgi:hypothetical protein
MEILRIIKQKIKYGIDGEDILKNITDSEIKKNIIGSVEKKHQKIAGGMIKDIRNGIEQHGQKYLEFMLDIDPNEKKLIELFITAIINKKITIYERENDLEPLIRISVEEYPNTWKVGPKYVI